MKEMFNYFNKGGKRKLHYFILVLTGIFLLLTAIVYFLPTTVIDYEFSEEVQEFRSPVLHDFMVAVSWFGGSIISVVLVVISAFFFFLFRYLREALFVLLSSVIWAINMGIKVLIDRPRPAANLVHVLVKAEHQSFPSGHTSFYVVFFGFLIFLMFHSHGIPKWLRYMVVVFSALLILSVPFSRVYLGAHWFTDVAAGFVLGLLVLYVLVRIFLYKKKE